jgi:hypothetical protein
MVLHFLAQFSLIRVELASESSNIFIVAIGLISFLFLRNPITIGTRAFEFCSLMIFLLKLPKSVE